MWMLHRKIYLDMITCLTPNTFCLYVPVPNPKPVIRWLSLVPVLHIGFSFDICTLIMLFVFSLFYTQILKNTWMIFEQLTKLNRDVKTLTTICDYYTKELIYM